MLMCLEIQKELSKSFPSVVTSCRCSHPKEISESFRAGMSCPVSIKCCCSETRSFDPSDCRKPLQHVMDLTPGVTFHQLSWVARANTAFIWITPRMPRGCVTLEEPCPVVRFCDPAADKVQSVQTGEEAERWLAGWCFPHYRYTDDCTPLFCIPLAQKAPFIFTHILLKSSFSCSIFPR